MLGPAHHVAIGLPGKAGGQLLRQAQGPEVRPCAAGQQPEHLVQLLLRLLVGFLRSPGVHPRDEDQLLPPVVEDDHLVEEHQINVAEVLTLAAQMQRGLGILDIVVGEVPHQPAGEGRHVRQPGAAVSLENLPDGLSGVRCPGHGLRPHAVLVHPADAQRAVLAGDLQRGGVAQEGIPAPAVVAGGALQQIAVTAGRPQRAHDLHRGEAIRQHLPADGNPPVIS